MSALLSLEQVAVSFPLAGETVQAVRGVSFEVTAGEALGLVGESGSGKSVTALSIMRLNARGALVNGRISFAGRDLLGVTEREMRAVRGGQIGMVFQDPMSSLNPVLTVGRQIEEALELHLRMTRRAAQRRAIELLELVGIPSAANGIHEYPHRFSGGMRQRVMIAIALSCRPRLLIADEPTTALDVTIQAQILDLLRELQREFGTAVILITHDLGVVAGMADRIAVMYAGQLVETGPAADVFARPSHPYTRGLLDSIARVDRERSGRLRPIEGQPPDLTREIEGCPFRPRCPFAFERCVVNPPLLPIDDNHAAACWLNAPAERARTTVAHAVSAQ